MNDPLAALNSQVQAEGQFLVFQVVSRAVRVDQLEQPRGCLDHGVLVAPGQPSQIDLSLHRCQEMSQLAQTDKDLCQVIGDEAVTLGIVLGLDLGQLPAG